VIVETRKLVGSNPNVILTRQTCGQRSGLAEESKRRALAFYFSVLLLCVPNIEMERGVRFRSVHDFGTCKKYAAA